MMRRLTLGNWPLAFGYRSLAIDSVSMLVPAQKSKKFQSLGFPGLLCAFECNALSIDAQKNQRFVAADVADILMDLGLDLQSLSAWDSWTGVDYETSNPIFMIIRIIIYGRHSHPHLWIWIRIIQTCKELLT